MHARGQIIFLQHTKFLHLNFTNICQNCTLILFNMNKILLRPYPTVEVKRNINKFGDFNHAGPSPYPMGHF